MNKLNGIIFYSNSAFCLYNIYSISKFNNEKQKKIAQYLIPNGILLCLDVIKTSLSNNTIFNSFSIIGKLSCMTGMYGITGSSIMYDILGDYYLKYLAVQEIIDKNTLKEEKIRNYIENNKEYKKINIIKESNMSKDIIKRTLTENLIMQNILDQSENNNILKQSLNDNLTMLSNRYSKYVLFNSYLFTVASLFISI
jgi:hypothetical protein